MKRTRDRMTMRRLKREGINEGEDSFSTVTVDDDSCGTAGLEAEDDAMSKLTGREYRRVKKLPTNYTPKELWRLKNEYEGAPRRVKASITVQA